MTAVARNKRLKVLFFSQRFPYPLDTGGKIRTGKLLEKLKDVFDITLICNMESPKDDPYLDQVKTLCSEFHPVSWKETRKYSLGFYVKLLRGMFSSYPFTVFNDYSRKLERKIMSLATTRQFDLLICDFLQPSLNFRNLKGQRTLLFQHNVESMIVKRHFEMAGNALSRLFWRLQWARMCRYEKKACSMFDGIIAVSENDKSILERQFDGKNVFAIPTGVDVEYFSPGGAPYEENTVVFSGSMDWLPNEDAMMFFAREILARIKRSIPTIKVTVVGRNPSRSFVKEMKNHPEISVLGWVDDVRPVIRRHAVCVIPLRIGGGTRIKAYEAMAMGKAIVSTDIGTEGLPVRDGEHVILANGAEHFAQAVIELLSNPELRRRIESGALEFVRNSVSWDKAAGAFEDVCWKVVNGQPLTCGSTGRRFQETPVEAGLP